ncbi:DUF1127 domain-containing protein [Thalassococcus sp. BH17M4-6]|uniref:DUF1127 domain-containing protein n=1 Tax=Thalassococcus sp. BH17M4-6 TaxID=3413148 RepID=UPI003BC2E85B
MAYIQSHAPSHSPRRRGGILATLLNFAALARQRRQLAALDPHLRRDLGLSDHDIRRETARGFWDAPATWHD